MLETGNTVKEFADSPEVLLKDRLRPLGLQLKLLDHEGSLSKRGAGCCNLNLAVLVCVLGSGGGLSDSTEEEIGGGDLRALR